MQQAKVLETWVGLFVALGLVALFFVAMQVSNLSLIRSSGDNFRITARFANSGGLKVRAPVVMAGVRLGRVDAITFDKETYEAVVAMRIDSSYDTLPVDSSASILTQGILGEQYIGLSPGASDEYLQEGDELDLTQSALVLEEVISRFLFSKAESSESKAEAEEIEEKEGIAPKTKERVVPASTPLTSNARENDRSGLEHAKSTPAKAVSGKPVAHLNSPTPAKVDSKVTPPPKRVSPSPAPGKKPSSP